jgi:hypothetical protein
MNITKNEYPSQAELKEAFTYSETEGQLLRNDKVAGSISMSSGGYRLIMFKGTRYVAHRLIWIYHNGSIPPSLTVDHIVEQELGVSKLFFNSKDVNYISNLQLLTKAQQQRKSIARNKSTNLIPGIRERKGRFTVAITVLGVAMSIGTFDTLEEAKLKRIASEIHFWGYQQTQL